MAEGSTVGRVVPGRAEGGLRTLAVAAAVLAALALAWPELLLRGLLPVTGDVLTFSFPAWRLTRDALASGHLPLWTSLKSMGEPLLADPQSMAAYPVFWVLAPFGGFDAFLRLWVLVHTALAAGFLGLLVYRRRCDAQAAALAAVLGGLNGFLASHATFPNQLAAAAWVPACLYAAWRRSPIGLGVCLAMQWLAGFPPFSLLTVLAVGVLAVAERGTGMRRLAGSGCVAFGLAAPQLLPFLELLGQAARGVVLPGQEAATFSMTTGLLATQVLLPQWRLFPVTMPGDPAEMSFYIGPVALLLAILAVVRGGGRERWLAAGAGACLVLSLGANLPGWAWLTPLHAFRFPAHWLLLATAASTLLAAEGLSRLGVGRWRWAVIAVVLLDCAWFCRLLPVGWARPELLQVPPPLASRLAAADGGLPLRILHDERLVERLLARPLPPTESVALLREVLFPSYAAACGVPEAKSYQVLRTRRAAAYLDRLERGPTGSELAATARVGHILTLKPGAGGVDRSSLVLLPTGAGRDVCYLVPPEAGHVTVRAYRAGHVKAASTVRQAALLVLPEVHYPGWRVEVDGRSAPLEVHKETFLAVRLAPGPHTVVFLYQPLSFRIGLALAILTVLALLVRGARVWRRSRSTLGASVSADR
ncbi:MAG: YfhO family protein [Thermoanaerobaculaceae bacterium]|nr:YfhO family protein [Thermoanaerobaculaceae bacterium]